jgi:hypothetical protein
VYVTGRFTGTVNLGATTLVSQVNAVNIFAAKVDGSSGSFVWAVAAGGPIDDRGNGIAVDNSGNVDITGTIDRTAVPGPGPTYIADFDFDGPHSTSDTLDAGDLSVTFKSSFLWQLKQA